MTSAPHTNIHARNPKDKNNKRTEINSHELTDTNRHTCAKDIRTHTKSKRRHVVALRTPFGTTLAFLAEALVTTSHVPRGM